MSELKKAIFPNVKVGETFQVGNMEFIRFPDQNGETPVVMKGIAFRSAFGKNNDLRSSRVLERMKKEILPKIIKAVGEENLCTIRTDLTSLDGLKNYGTMESLISLPTMDFYRENAEIFGQHKPGPWWWLATPFSVKPNDEDEDCVLCVSPAGYINYCCYGNDDFGVRPFCIFKSSIFES